VEEEEIAPSPQEKEKDESSFQYVTILTSSTIYPTLTNITSCRIND
jgi:hypothetical protein